MRKFSNWDLWGVVISAVCVVHCMAIPILLFVFPAVSLKFFPEEDLTHAVLLAFILGVGGIAFISGYRVHGQWRPVAWLVAGLLFAVYATFFAHDQLGHTWEPVVAILGSLCLIRAHYLNHQCKKCDHDHTHYHDPEHHHPVENINTPK